MDLSGPTIRPEAPDDAAAIHALTAAAFLEAPHTDHTEQFVVDALRAAGGADGFAGSGGGRCGRWPRRRVTRRDF
jgi:hypothetical protein